MFSPLRVSVSRRQETNILLGCHGRPSNHQLSLISDGDASESDAVVPSDRVVSGSSAATPFPPRARSRLKVPAACRVSRDRAAKPNEAGHDTRPRVVYHR